jgi:DNA-binding response OmpR family regulator
MLHENLPRRKVIVVDDNEILLRAWERILRKEGCRCFVTTNPEAALDHLEREGADLLISDIVMPHIDGFDLIQKVCRFSRRPRIILTTAYVCDFTRLKLEAGSDDVHVLMKPYNNIEEIRNFIHRILEGDTSLDEEEEDSLTSLDDVRVHLWSL